MNYFAWSSLYVYGISIAVFVAIGFIATISVNAGNVNVGISGVGFLHLFILGIAGIRSDLRFYLQHGISRRTTFFSHLYGSLICSAAIGLFCKIFNLFAGLLPVYTGGGSDFTIQSFLTGWMTHTLVFFFAWQIGALISLIYYRLGMMQQIVFTVAAITAILLTLLSSVRYAVSVSDGLGGMAQSAVESSFGFTSTLILATLLLGTLAAAGNYLLLRRAQIKE